MEVVRGGVGHKQTSTVVLDAVQLTIHRRKNTFQWDSPPDRQRPRRSRALHYPAPCTVRAVHYVHTNAIKSYYRRLMQIMIVYGIKLDARSGNTNVYLASQPSENDTSRRGTSNFNNSADDINNYVTKLILIKISGIIRHSQIYS